MLEELYKSNCEFIPGTLAFDQGTPGIVGVVGNRGILGDRGSKGLDGLPGRIGLDGRKGSFTCNVRPQKIG